MLFFFQRYTKLFKTSILTPFTLPKKKYNYNLFISSISVSANKDKLKQRITYNSPELWGLISKISAIPKI